MFSLIPVAVLLLVLSWALSGLEKKELIQTETKDDLVAHLPIALLLETKDSKGDPQWRLAGQEMVTGTIPVKKKKREFRIVCVGGSFIMGFPYTQPGEPNPGNLGILDWVRHDLSLRFPKAQIVLINFGALAQSSRRVADIVEKAMVLDPDLVYVATGNNEGNLAPSTISDALQKWVLYRAMKKILVRPAPLEKRSLFTPQDSNVGKIQKQFEQNIQSIIETCKTAQTPLLLSTVPINLRYSGYIPGTHDGGRPDSKEPWVGQGDSLLTKGKFDDAIRIFLDHKSDPNALYYLGKAYDGQDQFEKARQFYLSFVQVNPLTRTRPSFNEFVRSSAEQNDLLFADLERELDERSVGSIPNQTIYIDYCHLRWWGNAMLSRPLADAISKSGLLLKTGSKEKAAVSTMELIKRRKVPAATLVDPLSEGYEDFVTAWDSEGAQLPPPPRWYMPDDTIK